MVERNKAHQELVRMLIIKLSATGVCRVWAQNCGVAFRGEAAVRYGIIGGGDISGILCDGRRLEIEVKTGRGKQTEQQLNFEAMIRSHNGIYIVARDVETTIKGVLDEYNQRSNQLFERTGIPALAGSGPLTSTPIRQKRQT